jgi:hypothetical protein
MFEVKENKTFDNHEITHGYTVIIDDGENDIIYSGYNKLNQAILGVIIYEGINLYYFHITTDEKELTKFIDNEISLLDIISFELNQIFVVVKDFNGNTLDYNSISFHDIPDEYKPRAYSYLNL